MRTTLVVILMIVDAGFNALANIFLKMGMKDAGNISEMGLPKMIAKTVTNSYVWLGVLCFGVAFVCYSLVLTKLKLSVAYPIMTSLGFAVVAIAGYWLFDEGISLMKVAGLVAIIFGIYAVCIS